MSEPVCAVLVISNMFNKSVNSMNTGAGVGNSDGSINISSTVTGDHLTVSGWFDLTTD